MVEFDIIPILYGILVPAMNLIRTFVNMIPLSTSITYLIVSAGLGYFLRGRIKPESWLTTMWLLISGIILLALIFIK